MEDADVQGGVAGGAHVAVGQGEGLRQGRGGQDAPVVEEVRDHGAGQVLALEDGRAQGEGEQAAPYAALIETIDRYHDEVQVNSAAIMEEARQQVGKIGVIAKYNVRMAPFMEADNRQADMLIDTEHASCGATVADFGKTLGDGYVQQNDDGHDHLSADGIIDASTALYPDYTWFIKNAEHSRGVVYNDALLRHICESDRQPDVFEDEAYPQFTYYSPATGQTSPLTKDTDERPDTKLILRIKAFFQRILTFWRELFEKVC